jgi:hypothetical protein
MRKRDWEPLFSEYDLRAVLEGQLELVGDRVLAIPKEQFEEATDELLAAQVASRLTIPPLELAEDDISVSSKDTKVDVSRDPDRAIFDRSRPAYVDGTEVTYHVPYRGDSELLKCRPSSFTMNPPRAVVAPGELRFPYDQGCGDLAATKTWFERDLGELKRWIPWVNQQVAEYNGSLEAAARDRVIGRRAELERTARDIAALGFRVRSEDSESAPTTGTSAGSREARRNRRATSRANARRAYDVALSFAGEDRAFVDKVAERLRELGVSVFYDAFEQVNLWGADLAEHLGEVYGKDSRFVVLFASRHYAVKAWPTHEKQYALGRHLSGGERRILPVRFDDTEIPGIPPTVGYLDLRALTPDKLAELIRQKVDSNDSGA